MDRFIRDFKMKGIPFYWLRLTDKIAQSMLANNAMKFIDADLVRKYDLELTVKGNNVYDHGVKMAEIMGISNFYSKKGTAVTAKNYLTVEALKFFRLGGKSGEEMANTLVVRTKVN